MTDPISTNRPTTTYTTRFQSCLNHTATKIALVVVALLFAAASAPAHLYFGTGAMAGCLAMSAAAIVALVITYTWTPKKSSPPENPDSAHSTPHSGQRSQIGLGNTPDPHIGVVRNDGTVEKRH